MSALLELEEVSVEFRLRGAGLGRLLGREATTLRAVDRVNLSLGAGESVGLVGESGSGKTTLARVIVGLVRPDSGRVLLSGESTGIERDLAMRRRAQIVFQDPASSLNPGLSIERALVEPMRAHELGSKQEQRTRARELMDLVGLPPATLAMRPRQLSGGQRQRAAIARALTLGPELLVADEAVAALDVSVQAQIVALLKKLREEFGLALLFISHDLAVVRQLCDRVVVMYLGAVVEEGPADVVLSEPQHPYTRALLQAVPRLGAVERNTSSALRDDPPSPMALPSGCRFHPRCAMADPDLCSTQVPGFQVEGNHRAACHFAWTERMSRSRDPRASARAGGATGE